MKIKHIFPAVLLVLAVFLSGIGLAEDTFITSLDDLKDRSLTIGAPTDFDVYTEIMELCPKAVIKSFDDIMNSLAAIATGNLDAYVCGRSFIEEALAAGVTGIVCLEEPIKIFRCGLGLCETTELDNYVDRVNECIRQLREDGTLDDMNNRWFKEGSEVMPEIPAVEHPEYTLKVVTFGKAKPYSYIKDGKLIGFDVELSYRVAAALNCNIHLESAEYPAMLMGLATGKYDMVSASLYITEERTKNIVYSDAYSEMDIAIAVRAPEEAAGSGSLGQTILTGLKRTFIDEQRWKMILSGLVTTLVITVCGFLLANVIGGIFCALALSRRKFCRVLADIYAQLIEGTPLVVILLLLFYVVFARSSIPGICVAIIGFGLTCGSGLAQLFHGAVSSVDRGQIEASLALGFTKAGTFFGVTLPQSVRRILPGYFAQLIGLMKGTSIVGYIAVVDLTKVSDIIRSSTFDAFFPLISVALVYFMLAFLILKTSKALQKKLEPRRTARQEASK